MRNLAFAVVLLVLSCSSVGSLIAAESNHSLHWGVEVGDEVVLVLQRKVMDPSFVQYLVGYAPFITNVSEGQRVIARVTSLSPIPSLINGSDQIPQSNCTLIRENDSVVVGEDFSMVVIPSGDWDFMTSIGNYTAIEGMTVINSQDEWGTIMEGSVTWLIFTVTFHIEMRYEKSNGTLKLLRANVDLSGNDIIDIVFAKWQPGMPTVLPAELQGLTVTVVTLVAVLLAGVAFFVWRRHRRGLLSAETPTMP